MFKLGQTLLRFSYANPFLIKSSRKTVRWCAEKDIIVLFVTAWGPIFYSPWKALNSIKLFLPPAPPPKHWRQVQIYLHIEARGKSREVRGQWLNWARGRSDENQFMVRPDTTGGEGGTSQGISRVRWADWRGRLEGRGTSQGISKVRWADWERGRYKEFLE